MNKIIFLAFAFFGFSELSAQNVAPLIFNFEMSLDVATKKLNITYDLTDPDNSDIEIVAELSGNYGENYALTPLVGFTGDVGFPINPGSGKTLTCDVASVISSHAQFTVRLTALDRELLDIQAVVNEVDSNMLREQLRFMQGVRHRSGNPTHLQEVRDSMTTFFSNSKLFARSHSFAFNNSTGYNLSGSLPGYSTPTWVYIVDGHYDTVFESPGADDNGSGTVGMMEAARILGKYPAKKTLRFIGFDLEESGLIGSQRYVGGQIPTGDLIDGVINLEMIGCYQTEPNSQTTPVGFAQLFPAAFAEFQADQFRGNFITNVGNSFSQTLVDVFENNAAMYVPALKTIPLVVPGNGTLAPDLLRSDHAPFWLAGYKALMITDGSEFRYEHYHSENDTLENLNFTFMSQAVKATVASLIELAGVQHGWWEIETVSNPVSAPEISDCNWNIWQTNPGKTNFMLENNACFLGEMQISFYNESGALVAQKTQHLNEMGNTPIEFGQQLPIGNYFLSLKNKDLQVSRAVFVK